MKSAILYLALFAQAAHTQPRQTRMEITVERQDGKVWKRVDPALVLDTGDVIRFRFKSSFTGYLYVTDYGTSGSYTLLFPREESGKDNLVQAGKEYLIPATAAHFRVSGPPGYDSVYWYVSPVALGPTGFTPPRPSNYKPPVLTPRCDDTVLHARGLCLDPQAGPRSVEDNDKLPGTSRELTIVQEGNHSVVSAAGSASAPMLYEFRLAHK